MGGDPGTGSRGVPDRACQRCGAGLRRGRAGELCEPCSRRSGASGPLLEAEFFTHEPIRRALIWRAMTSPTCSGPFGAVLS